MKKTEKAFSLIELSIVILIIGILIAGITQSSRLVSKMKLASARQLTQSSPVSSIQNLALWIDSTSESSFADSEQDDQKSISTWFDLNPQTTDKSNLTRGSGSTNLYYKTDSINGLPAVYFGGTNEFMLGSLQSSGNYFVNNGDFTVFIVGNLPTITAATYNTILQFNADSGGTRLFGVEVNAGNLIIDGKGPRRTGPSFSSYVGKNILLTSYGNSSVTMAYIQGSGSTALINAAGGSGYSISGRFVVGSYVSSSAYNSGATNCYIGEIIVFGRSLKTEERKSVEQYLARKWGITIS